MQVLGPSCGTYCFESNSCVACTDGEDTCSTGPQTSFCGFTSECVDPNNLGSCSGVSPFAIHTDGAYEVKYKNTVTATIG